jgi:two-component sensor histidine kinase
MEIDGLDGQRETLMTIVSELFSNALEHGLLGLDSSLKSDAEGFSTYYGLRHHALQSLTTGRVSVELTHVPLEAGRRIVVKVEDSGGGFDVNAAIGSPSEGAMHGRGLRLVGALCRELRFLGSGNTAEAVYEWPDRVEEKVS